MDDHVGGRTDDHLFSDDFEPAPPELAQPTPTPTTMSHDNILWTEETAEEALDALETTKWKCPQSLRLSNELKQLREQSQVPNPDAKDFVPSGRIDDTSSNDKQKGPKPELGVLYEAKKADALEEVGNEEEGEDDIPGFSHEQSTTTGSAPPSGVETMASGAGTGITTPADGPPQDDSHETPENPRPSRSPSRRGGHRDFTGPSPARHGDIAQNDKGSEGPSSKHQCRTCGTTFPTSKALKEHHTLSKRCKGSNDSSDPSQGGISRRTGLETSRYAHSD